VVWTIRGSGVLAVAADGVLVDVFGLVLIVFMWLLLLMLAAAVVLLEF
jgi:hypothetical protein